MLSNKNSRSRHGKPPLYLLVKGIQESLKIIQSVAIALNFLPELKRMRHFYLRHHTLWPKAFKESSGNCSVRFLLLHRLLQYLKLLVKLPRKKSNRQFNPIVRHINHNNNLPGKYQQWYNNDSFIMGKTESCKIVLNASSVKKLFDALYCKSS